MTKIHRVGTPDRIVAGQDLQEGDIVVLKNIITEVQEVPLNGGVRKVLVITEIRVKKATTGDLFPYGIVASDTDNGEEIESFYLFGLTTL